MKDPTGEILTAFATALAAMSYNSKTWAVYKEQPPKGKRNYIYLSDVNFTDSGDQDHLILDGNILIQVSAIKDKYCRTIVNSLSNSIVAALEGVTLSLTSFTMIISSIVQDISLSEEIEGNTNYIKTITLNTE